MASLILRLIKGSPLTNAEVDGNFTALNDELVTKITASSSDTLTNKTLDDISNTIGADHIHFKVKATENLVAGNVVKVTGYNSGENAYEVAKVSSATDVAVGVVHGTIATGEFGAIVNTGLLEGFDTSAFSVGQILYPNTSGGFTATQPSSGTYQALAFVLRSHAIHGTVLIEASEPAPVRTSSNTGNTVVLRDASGNFSAGTITAALSGNATTATSAGKWTTARTLSFTGDATGSGSVDGSANVATTLTLANSGVTAGVYGSATSVPVITVDAKGRVTTVTTSAISGALTFTGDVTGTGSTGSSTSLTLANSGVTAGTYTKVAVDAKGRVTTGASLVAEDVPTLNQSTTGNAATATALQTARTINGVSFDGSANITIADSTKLPLSGGTVSGPTIFTDTVDMRGHETLLPGHFYTNTHDGSNVYFHVGAGGSTTNKSLHLRVFNSSGSYSTTSFTSAGDIAVPGSVSANGFYAGASGGQRIYSFFGGTGNTIRQGLGVDLTGESYNSAWFGSAGNTNQGSLSLGFVDHATGTSFSEIFRVTATGNAELVGQGNLLFRNSGTTRRGILGTCADNDFWFIGGGGTGSNAGYLEIATGDDAQTAGASEPIYVSQYGPGSPVNGTLYRRATLLGPSGQTEFPVSLGVGGPIDTANYSGDQVGTTIGQVHGRLRAPGFSVGNYSTSNWAALGAGGETDGMFTRAAGQCYIVVDDIFRIRDNSDPNSEAKRFEFNTDSGSAGADANWNSNAFDFAEMFEWADGNPDDEDRIGYAVALVPGTGKIRKAEATDDPIGVVSGTAGFVGDSGFMGWAKMYETDEWGRPVYEYLYDEAGNPRLNKYGEHARTKKLNPDYDPDTEYVQRRHRKEWATVGLLGKVFTRVGQPMRSTWLVLRAVSETIELRLVR
mgnify:CR=1 FL=1